MTRTLVLTSTLLALTACATSADGQKVLDLAEDDAHPFTDDLTPGDLEPTLGASNTWYARWRGESGNDRLGISLANGGDLDGDGDDDILLGSLYASGSGSGDGAVYQLNGPTAAQSVETTRANARYLGDAGTKAGQMVSGGGDVDGDGNDDFIVGAVSDSTVAANAGAAWIVSGGSSGESDISNLGVQLTGVASGDRGGNSVDIVGDLNGDGFADVVVTATGYNDTTNSLADAGAAYVFYGPVSDGSLSDAAVTITGSAASQQLGTRAVGVGDNDGDGLDDFMVSARLDDTNGTNSGAAYLFTSEADDATVADATATILGTDDDDNLGNQLHDGAFDINGDGYDDLLIGALGAGVDAKGEAYVFYGPTAGALDAADFNIRFRGQQAGDQFGSALAAGDMDGDGDIDIFVGANRHTASDRGAGYIYYDPAEGTILGSDADVYITGSLSNAYFGSWAALVHGANADGGDLLVVGESNRGNGSFPERGIVYLFPLPL